MPQERHAADTGQLDTPFMAVQHDPAALARCTGASLCHKTHGVQLSNVPPQPLLLRASAGGWACSPAASLCPPAASAPCAPQRPPAWATSRRSRPRQRTSRRSARRGWTTAHSHASTSATFTSASAWRPARPLRRSWTRGTTLTSSTSGMSPAERPSSSHSTRSSRCATLLAGHCSKTAHCPLPLGIQRLWLQYTFCVATCVRAVGCNSRPILAHSGTSLLHSPGATTLCSLFAGALLPPVPSRCMGCNGSDLVLLLVTMRINMTPPLATGHPRRTR